MAFLLYVFAALKQICDIRYFCPFNEPNMILIQETIGVNMSYWVMAIQICYFFY